MNIQAASVAWVGPWFARTKHSEQAKATGGRILKIAILGAGNVGGALGKAWARAGHVIVYGVPVPDDPKHRTVAASADDAQVLDVHAAARDADVIVLAVPFDAARDAIRASGDLSGRVVIEATNPLRPAGSGLELSLGFSTSGGEQAAEAAKGAAVFKTLNQIGFQGMSDASVYPVPPVMFVAGDDAANKPTVMQLVADLGFEAIDAGGLSAARLLEPLAMLWIHMTVNQGTGGDRAFAYVRRNRT
jgi:8-hydroxy-5-deazaflavin:NADPH oxidoreductase